MHRPASNTLGLGLLVLLFTCLLACGDDSDSGGSGGGGTPSNRARFTFDCDLLGVTGALTMDIEVINTAGIVFGSGPNPSVTGVIGTGEVLYVTSGELRSPVAFYVFTGENDFADFTDTLTGERFLVQWLPNELGLTMLINPFGPGPTQHTCVLTGSQYL